MSLTTSSTLWFIGIIFCIFDVFVTTVFSCFFVFWEKTDAFLKARGAGKSISGAIDLKDFVEILF